MDRFERRIERLDDIERKLVRYAKGLTTGELARAYGVDRSTIHRDMGVLEGRGTGVIKEGRRWRLDHRRSLFTAKFSQYEVAALFIATRLLARHSDEHNPHAVSALEKLADALRGHSPEVTRRILGTAAEIGERAMRSEYVRAFEAVTEGWLRGRKVCLVYRSSGAGQRTERTFAPYVVEPAGPGFACYVIGMDDLRGEVRTLKLERIEGARLTDEHFTLPDGFDPVRTLASAWGIWWDEEAQQEVRLLFNARVARRLKESVWHPSQRIEELPGGACLFTVRVGSLVELKPWIRQWGADAEVLSPPQLREELAAEAQALARVYSLAPSAVCIEVDPKG